MSDTLQDLINELIISSKEVKLINDNVTRLKEQTQILTSQAQKTANESATTLIQAQKEINNLSINGLKCDNLMKELNTISEEVNAKYSSMKDYFEKESKLQENLNKHLLAFNENKNDNELILNEFNELHKRIKEEINNYKDVLDNNLKENQNILSECKESLGNLVNSSEETKELVEKAKEYSLNAKEQFNNIIQLRQRSECLIKKADTVFENANSFRQDLDTYIEKINNTLRDCETQSLKNEKLEELVKSDIEEIKKINLFLKDCDISTMQDFKKAVSLSTSNLIAINKKYEDFEFFYTNSKEKLKNKQDYAIEQIEKLKSDCENIINDNNEEIVKLKENIFHKIKSDYDLISELLQAYEKKHEQVLKELDLEKEKTQTSLRTLLQDYISDKKLLVQQLEEKKQDFLKLLEEKKQDFLTISEQKNNSLNSVYSKLSNNLETLINNSETYQELQKELMSKVDIKTYKETDNAVSKISMDILYLQNLEPKIALKANVFTKQEVNERLSYKVNRENVYIKSEITNFLKEYPKTNVFAFNKVNRYMLPNGLVIQYGTVSAQTIVTVRSINFPFAFANKCIFVSMSPTAISAGQAANTASIVAVTKTNFSFKALAYIATGMPQFGNWPAINYMWIAIGY